ALMEKTIGLSAKRSLPKYANKRFDRWFNSRSSRAEPRDPDAQPLTELPRDPSTSLRFARDDGIANRVILWDDTFIRYNESHIDIAAVKVWAPVALDARLLRSA